MLAPGSDRIPVELFQILTQYAICRLPAINNRNDMDLTEAEDIRSANNTQKNHTKKIFMTQIIMMV